MTNINDFDYIKINLASPKCIRKWGERMLPNGKIIGEVNKPDTINYRTFKPEMGGLFCERIFGPVKNWECFCGKYKQIKSKEVIICERCGVEITESRIRRHRMGYIELISPTSHVWYLKGIPSYISLILKKRLRTLEEIIYFCKPLDNQKEREEFFYHQNLENQIVGAEVIKNLLKEIDLNKDLIRNRLTLSLRDNNFYKNKEESHPEPREKLIRRIRLIENFLATRSKPSWMILDVIPVLPPGLRPMVQLEGGRFATSDLNELYRRLITRNNRLGRLIGMFAPAIVIHNEKRLLQEAIDTLIDNGKRGRKMVGTNNRPLKSLSDIIEGKEGRFRQNLLGKRVDYSARSVIVVGPSLKLNQCGLPHEIVLELFQPFIIHELIKNGLANNIRLAKKLVENGESIIWKILEKILKNYPVLLNRAPTLHRLGIQAFEAILVPGRAIHLHPLVCTAFNADFDGDQMAIHLPLSENAKLEAKTRMLASNNFLSTANGDPIISATQDMVLGCYYLSVDNPLSILGVNQYFNSFQDVILAYDQKKINLHSPIWVISKVFELENEINEKINIQPIKGSNNKYIRTTAGRIILNSSIYKNLNL